MQSDIKAIYKMTSERTGVSSEVYKDVGTAVFKALRETFLNPPKLIVKVRGLGSWYLRRKRMQIVVDNFDPRDARRTTPLERKAGIIRDERRADMYDLFKERLKEYEEWTKVKKDIKEQRNAKALLSSPDREDKSETSSQADVEKH